ncbi:uncharacterized protein LOC141614167 [Silene latifolia]|uniref:uncharacterized protein LOC141614167 n=1 Tax=Silene latifolia TaxID=37657 RepID=UPI003D77DBBB
MTYAFNGNSEKTPLWDNLNRLASQIAGPWAVAGDFNCVLSPTERVGGNTPSGAIYTWNNKQKPDERIYSRIDRFMVNKAWCDNFTDLYAHFMPEGLYDHTPCVVKSSNQGQSKRSFKYFNMWGGSKKFLPLVRGHWDAGVTGTPMFRLVKNLKRMKPVLKKLNLEGFSDIEGATNILQKLVEEMQEEITRDPNNMQLISEEYEATLKLQELAKAKESFLSQKAKHQWIKEGDTNSAFFHGILKKRRNMNKVVLVEDMNGKECDSPDQIQEAFLEYYTTLLGSSQETNKVHKSIIGQGPICTVEHWTMLLKPVTGLEIKEALFSIPDIKSPGPDGYTMEWNFVRQLLDALNFPSEFKSMIIQCITSATYSLSVNGEMFDYFHGKRGLRQGDPLSPLIFTLCMEYLTRTLHKGDAKSMMLLLQAFSTFSKASGLKVSSAKSSAFFINVPEQLKHEILQVSGFSEGQIPFKYLGMPIQTTRLKKQDCECLVDKICSRIHGYGARKFSYAGRFVIVSSVLTSLHSYWASMFVMPKGVIKRIEAVYMNFLWDNSADYMRIPLVCWDTICRPKEEGRLGIKDQESWNKAMVGRLVDWVAMNRDSIWVHWVHNNYLKGQDWMDYKPSMNSSWVWRRICKIKEEMVAGSYEWFKGNRPKVNWYKVVWNGWVIPKHQFMGWLIAHAALNTTSKLVGFGVDIENTCCICAQAEETIEHLFCECVYSSRVVREVNKLTRWDYPESGVLNWCTQRTGTVLQKGIQNAMMLSLLYQIWHQRNKCRNEKILMFPEHVAKKVTEEIRARVRGRERVQMTSNARESNRKDKGLLIEDDGGDGSAVEWENGTDEAKGKCLLVGKLWASRSINVKAAIETMIRLWNPSKPVMGNVVDAKEKTFVFRFDGERDKARVVNGQPWHFEKFIWCFNEPNRSGKVTDVPLCHLPIWSRVYDLSISGRASLSNIKRIGENLGTFQEADLGQNYELDRAVRIRIIHEVQQPLKATVPIKMKDGRVVNFDVKYERLLIFCYGCKVMGHGEKDCEHGPYDDEDLVYGESLRASPSKVTKTASEGTSKAQKDLNPALNQRRNKKRLRTYL